MKTIRRYFRWLAMAALLLAVAAGVAYVLFLPAVAHAILARTLRQSGISESQFDVQSVSLSRIDLANLHLGDASWGKAAAVRADYSLGTLWRGRVHALTVRDAIWTWRIRDGAIDLGPLPGGTSQSAAFADLPFDTLQARNLLLRIDDGQSIRTVRLNGAASRIGAGMFDVDLTLLPGEPFPLGSESLQIRAVGANLKLRLHMRDEYMSLRVRDECTIGIDQIALGSGDEHLTTSATQVVLSAIEGRRLARVSKNRDGLAMEIDAQLTATGTFQVSAPIARAFVPGASVVVSIRSQPGQPIQILSNLSAEAVTIRAEDQPLVVTGVNFNVPLDVNQRAMRQGPVTVGSVIWGDENLPGFSASAGMMGSRVQAEVHWPIVNNAMLSASADVTLEERPRGTIMAELPPTVISDAAIIRQIVPALEQADLGGTIGLHATLSLTPEGVEPDIQVTAIDAIIQHRDWPLKVDALSGTIAIDGLAPFSTKPGQRLTLHKGRIGSLPLNDSEITFEVQPSGTALINAMNWNMGDYGRFEASPFSFLISNPSISTNISANDVHLGPWLALLSSRRAGGEGILHGDVSIQVDHGERTRITVNRGTLRADPATGTTYITNASTINRLLESGALGDPSDPRVVEVRNRLVDALLDFQYSQLSVEFVPEGSGVVCRIQTAGRGRRGDTPQEIASLTVNIRNFNDALNEAVFYGGMFNAIR